MTERRVIDLSHVIREGMITYPGLPAPAPISIRRSTGTATDRISPGSTWRAWSTCPPRCST
ncbi:MAG TPA: hypothetical protein VL294_09750 [Pseudolysinimonas sp.]|nr:hypothetical protein [Pseudolysinimonas sp.]